MIVNTSNIRIYGPRLPEAILRLTTLASTIEKDLPIKKGEIIMGKYDFVFYWKDEPTPESLLRLIGKIDEILIGLPTKYSITTEGPKTYRQTAEFKRKSVNTIFTFVRVHGPSISKAVRAIEEVAEELESIKTIDILKSSILLGEFDFAFEWKKWPSFEDIHKVLEVIDRKVEPTGALYTITTKKNIYRTGNIIDDPTSDNLMAFL